MRPTPTDIETNVPAFLSKLWKIVNDPDTDNLICWSPGGNSFVIQNKAQFGFDLLPIYYKHNNMSSFIRQLNMYGFHKLTSENGGIESDKDEIKFFHPLFQQYKPNLLKFIKRKIATNKSAGLTADDKVNNVDQITRVLVDVKHLRGRQESVDNQLAAMKQENAALWRELALLRQKHMKQQQIVNKLIHFLVTIVQPSRNGLGGLGVKRRYPLMINDGRHKILKTELASDGPTIHELDPEQGLSDTLLANETDADQSVNSPASSTSNLADSPSVLLNISISDASGNTSDNPKMLLVDVKPNKGISVDVHAPATENDAETDMFEQTPPNDETFLLKDDKQQEITEKDILEVANEYIELDVLKDVEHPQPVCENSKSKTVINPNMQDAIIVNLVDDVSDNDKSKANNTFTIEEKVQPNNDMTVATRNKTKDRNNFKVNTVDEYFRDDLDSHLESTQDELDNIKEMLFDGYSLDANALLGNEVNYRYDAVPLQLFNPDESFPVDVPQISIPEENGENIDSNYDPMLSGSELTTFTNTPFMLDFENLFEDNNTSDTVVDNAENPLNLSGLDDEINTPIAIKKEPTYPTISKCSYK